MDPLLLTAQSRIGSNTLSVTMTSTLLSSLMVSGLRKLSSCCQLCTCGRTKLDVDPNKSIPSFFLWLRTREGSGRKGLPAFPLRVSRFGRSPLSRARSNNHLNSAIRIYSARKMVILCQLWISETDCREILWNLALSFSNNSCLFHKLYVTPHSVFYLTSRTWNSASKY